jgi:hypothetical protein
VFFHKHSVGCKQLNQGWSGVVGSYREQHLKDLRDKIQVGRSFRSPDQPIPRSPDLQMLRSPDHPITRSPDHPITRSPDPQITRCTQSPRLIPRAKGLSSIIPRSRVISNPRAERVGEKSAPLRFRLSHQSPLNFTLHLNDCQEI